VDAPGGFDFCLGFVISQEDHLEIREPFGGFLFGRRARGNVDAFDPGGVKFQVFAIVILYFGKEQKFVH
jgi:hypothetical protein